MKFHVPRIEVSIEPVEISGPALEVHAEGMSNRVPAIVIDGRDTEIEGPMRGACSSASALLPP